LIAKWVDVFWRDNGVRIWWNYHRGKCQISDSCAYFFDHIARIADPAYLPNVDDVIQCRVRTTGIVRNDFRVRNMRFEVVDVGGQRSERKKWIHCFECINSLIFVVAISEFDQKTFEDQTTNRIDEAHQLFLETVKSEWFVDTSIVLFLNKKDLFDEKIKYLSLKKYCPGFIGDETNPSDGYQYFERRFIGSLPPRKTPVYTHVTCLTDSKGFELIFKSNVDRLIRQVLEGEGF